MTEDINYGNIDLGDLSVKLPINPAEFSTEDLSHVIVEYTDLSGLTIPYYKYDEGNDEWTTPDRGYIQTMENSLWKGKNFGPLALATKTPSNEAGIKEYSIIDHLAFEDGQDLTDIACTTYTGTGDYTDLEIDYPEGPPTEAPTEFPFYIKNSFRYPKGLTTFPTITFIHDPQHLNVPQTFRVFFPEPVNVNINVDYKGFEDEPWETGDTNCIHILGAQQDDKFEFYYLFNYGQEQDSAEIWPQWISLDSTNKQGEFHVYCAQYIADWGFDQSVDEVHALDTAEKTSMEMKIDEVAGKITTSEIDSLFNA